MMTPRRFRGFPLRREDSAQRRENATLRLPAEESWIILKVECQYDLPGQRRVFQELELRAPEIRIGLCINHDVFGLQYASGLWLYLNRSLALIDGRMTIHLNRSQ